MDDRSNGLTAWQWSLYPDGHRDRTNLVLHLLTVPLFMSGTIAIVVAPFVSPWLWLGGPVGMLLAIVGQGRGHKREVTQPVAFRGPLDVVLRLFTEQWVTFPRFVLTGKLAQAWRDAR